MTSTLLALRATIARFSQLEEQAPELECAAIISLTEERASQLLEYVTHMKYVRTNWPEAWVIYAFEPEGPLFIPSSLIQIPRHRNYLILPEAFATDQLLVTADNALLISAEGASWQTTDTANTRKIFTKEVDDHLLRLLASGMPLSQLDDNLDFDDSVLNAYLLDPQASLSTH